jgi:hypothetical protein
MCFMVNKNVKYSRPFGRGNIKLEHEHHPKWW